VLRYDRRKEEDANMASTKRPPKGLRAGTAAPVRKAKRPSVPKKKSPPRKPATRLSRDL
jgi:hypothetical protein